MAQCDCLSDVPGTSAAAVSRHSDTQEVPDFYLAEGLFTNYNLCNTNQFQTVTCDTMLPGDKR